MESCMTLRLVSSGDDRALAIRDHLVPIVRERGMWSFNAASCGWSPCGPAPGPSSTGRPSASCPRTRRPRPATGTRWSGSARGRTCPTGSTCGATGARVLGVLWSEDGASQVAAFVRGPWEDEALALAP
jgi:hypothetical protein